jgi:hypothetical protein
MFTEPISFKGEYMLDDAMIKDIINPKSHTNKLMNLHSFLLWDSVRTIYQA